MPIVTNDEFLTAIFGARSGDARVVLKPGDPNVGGYPDVAWRDVTPARRAVLAQENTFFTVSLFSQPNRQGKNFESCHVLVIDDVGVKMDQWKTDNFLPPPSYVLETSPGSFHYGYILKTPETDDVRWDALIDGVVAFLSLDGKDPGMRDVTRLVRMPEGWNGKPKYGPSGFACRMVVWEPGNQYEVPDLGAAVQWKANARATRRHSGASVGPGDDPDKDVIFGWLKEWGEVSETSRTNDGGYRMDCPWVAEHSVHDTLSGAYYVGSRGYKCWHGHCEDTHGRRDFERWANARRAEELGVVVSADFGVCDREAMNEVAARVFGVRVTSQPSHVPGSRTGNVVDEFFDELIYLGPDDRFLSTRTGETLSRMAADCTWRARPRAVGALPEEGRRLMEPSNWYLHEDNLGRARIADRLTYWPGEGVFFRDGVASLANNWRAPDRYPLPVTDAEVTPWLDLVRHIVGGEGAHIVESVLDLFALIVGEPGAKPGWHLVVQGGQGIGKDMMLQPVIEGVGHANVGTVNAVSLHSPFNPWAEKRLVVVNELKQNSRGSATGSDQYTTLKELTENANKEITINQKNMKAYKARNVSAFIITSNDEAAIAMEGDDRRFLIVMAKLGPLSAGFYAALAAFFKAGGTLKVAEWLWQRREAMTATRRKDLNGTAPMTAGKRQMIANGEDPVTGFMREQIETGAWPDLMTSEDVQAALVAGARTGAGFGFVPSPHKWGAIMKRLGGAKVYGGGIVRLKSGAQRRVWAVRAPERFDGWPETQIATAVASLVGRGFADLDDGKVTPIKPPVSPVKE